MDENRDDILNDLIKYYDNGKSPKPHDASKKDDGKSSDDAQDLSMGDTRIVNAPATPPVTSGDTVVVNLKSSGNLPHNNPEESVPVSDETMRIAPPVHESEPVQEEVLGNLGLDGLPVTDNDNKSSYDNSYDNQDSYCDDGFDADFDNELDDGFDDEYSEYDQDDGGYSQQIYRRPRRGIWYLLKPLWISLIICAFLAGGFKFYMTDTGIIGTYKRNFEYNMNMLLDIFGINFDADILEPITGGDTNGGSQTASADDIFPDEASSGTQYVDDEGNNVREEVSSQYDTVKANTVTLPFEEAGSSGFSIFDNGVVCAKSNYLCYINSAGVKKWEFDTSVQNPILKTAGNYIAVASKNGTRLSLYKKDELQYSIDIANRIISCDISSSGDVVLVTEKNAYKGAVSVINKRGEEIFSWSSGVNYITDASILKTRVVAVSLVNTEANVNSYLMMFDVSSPQPFAGVELKNTLVFDVFNNNSDVFSAGDNSITSIKNYGEMNYDKRFDNVYLTHSANDLWGNRLLSFTQDNTPVLNMYDKHGELDYTFTIDNTPDYIDVYNNTILYNNKRDIVCGKAADENKTCYTARMDIKDLMLINSKTYLIIYENSIEFVRI